MRFFCFLFFADASVAYCFKRPILPLQNKLVKSMCLLKLGRWILKRICCVLVVYRFPMKRSIPPRARGLCVARLCTAFRGEPATITHESNLL